MRKNVLASLLFLSALSAHAKEAAHDCDNAWAQSEMNICAYDEYKKADAELNMAYQKAVSIVGLASIKEVQTAWLKYRDLHCKFMAARYEGGSIQPMVIASCLTSLTIQRTEILESLIEELLDR